MADWRDFWDMITDRGPDPVTQAYLRGDRHGGQMPAAPLRGMDRWPEGRQIPQYAQFSEVSGEIPSPFPGARRIVTPGRPLSADNPAAWGNFADYATANTPELQTHEPPPWLRQPVTEDAVGFTPPDAPMEMTASDPLMAAVEHQRQITRLRRLRRAGHPFDDPAPDMAYRAGPRS